MAYFTSSIFSNWRYSIISALSKYDFQDFTAVSHIPEFEDAVSPAGDMNGNAKDAYLQISGCVTRLEMCGTGAGTKRKTLPGPGPTLESEAI